MINIISGNILDYAIRSPKGLVGKSGQDAAAAVAQAVGFGFWELFRTGAEQWVSWPPDS